MKNMYLIIYLLTFFSFVGCNHGIEKEIYLIPSNFKGKINVVFNQAKGEPIRYEEGVRIYEIPKDGILLTQFKEQQGLIKREYFYSEGNNRKPLKIVIDMDNADNSEVSVFRDGTIGVYGNSNDKNSLTYQEFYITDKNNFESYFLKDSIDDFDKRLQLKTGYKY